MVGSATNVCAFGESVCASGGSVCAFGVSTLLGVGRKSVACEDNRILLAAGMRTGADLVRTRELRAGITGFGELACEPLVVRLRVAREVGTEGWTFRGSVEECQGGFRVNKSGTGKRRGERRGRRGGGDEQGFQGRYVQGP